jgi:hypothetical protein
MYMNMKLIEEAQWFFITDGTPFIYNSETAANTN